MAFWNNLKKMRLKDVASYAVGGPIGGTIYNEYKQATTPPNVPEYEPSAWETESYDWMKNIREGKSDLLNTENTYQLLKEKMQPEYQRLHLV